jgi:hypothetical protein
MIAIALLLCLQESTHYYTDAYAPDYLIRRQPWQAIAVDSKGQVVVAHPYAVGAGNRSVPSGGRSRSSTRAAKSSPATSSQRRPDACLRRSTNASRTYWPPTSSTSALGWDGRR